jgi:hypothetical protein
MPFDSGPLEDSGTERAAGEFLAELEAEEHDAGAR